MLLFNIGPSSVFSSWKLVARFEANVRCSFFFNELRGFVGIDGISGIKRTSDGGKTWFDCITPFGSPYPYFGYITDIFMKDSLNGWAGIEDDYFSHGLWFTIDGGVSWHEQLKVVGTVTSVYQTPSAVIYGDRYTINKLSVSTDGGVTFSRRAFDDFNGINFVDDLHGVASIYYGVIRYTSDGGLTWQKTTNPLDSIEAWGVYAQKGSSNFIIAGEKSARDLTPPEYVYSSSDYGVSWQTVGLLPGRTTGHIAGVGSVIYVQGYTRWQYPNPPSFVGMNRSTDGGRTWKNVGGPSNYRDSRFSVMGCIGGIVYAFDESGGVWKTTDGGDGQFHEGTHNPNLNPDHLDLSSSLCQSVSATLSYNNLSCFPLQIESVGFIDSTDPAVSSGALSFTHYPALSQTLDPTGADFFAFSWDPKKMGVQKPLSTTFVKVHSTMQGGTIILDTLIAINSQSFANQPVFSLNTTKVKIDSMNICQRFVDTTLTFISANCDTLWLDSAILAGSSDWKLLDPKTFSVLTLPIGLGPGETASFVIRFNPTNLGTQAAKLQLQFLHQGLRRDTVIALSALCYRTFTVYGDENVNLGATSICIGVDTVVHLHNFNCDTLTVDDFRNSNSTDFSDISGLSFPYQLPPDSSLALRLRYNAVKNNNSNATIIFHYHLGKDSSFWEVKLNGRGLPGTSAFATTSVTPNLSFSDRLACSPPDSMEFTIFNIGCDSLTVLSSTLSGLGLPAISYRTEPQLPTILWKPGDSVKVIVYLQADKPTTNDGTLGFSFVLSDGTKHDSIFTIHAIVSQGERKAILLQNPIDLGMGSLCIERDTSIVITNPGCPSLTVEDITVSGNYYAKLNARQTPFDLATDESETIHVAYIPTNSGNDVGQVQVKTNADRNPLRIIPLSASTRAIDHVSFRLVQQNSGLHAGDTAIFAFIPDLDWSGKGLRSIDFSIATNSDLLAYNRHTEQADKSFQAIVTPVSLSGSKSQFVNVQLKSPTEITLHKDQPLVSFYYGTTLTDTISTQVSLALLEINHSDPHYLNCILSPATQDGDFTLLLECGGKTLVDFLKGKMPILTDDPHPNPVTSQTNYQAVLPFTTTEAGTAEVEFYDALGKQVSAETIEIEKPGKYSAHFDGSKFSGGSYEYTIRFKDNSSNIARGHIIVLK